MPHCGKSKRRPHATTQRKSANDGWYGNGQLDKLTGKGLPTYCGTRVVGLQPLAAKEIITPSTLKTLYSQ